MSKKNETWQGLFGRIYDNSKGLGKSVQKGSVTYARTRVTITSIIFTFICIGFIIFGIICLKWAGDVKTVDATVKCQGGKTKCCDKVVGPCKVDLEFDSHTVTNFKLSQDNEHVKNDDKLKITYSKKKPTDKDEISDSFHSWKIMGICLTIIPFFVIGLIWAQYYLVQKSEFAATATAASNVSRMFR